MSTELRPVPHKKKNERKRKSPFKTLLLIDNVPQNTENGSKSSDEVNAVFISANTKSILLPIDQGVIFISSLIN